MKNFVIFALSLILAKGFSQSTTWKTDLNDGNISPKPVIGTNNQYPLKFYTDNVERMVVDSVGNLKVNNLSGEGAAILTVNSNGTLSRLVGGGGGSISCGTSLLPWVIGGNVVSGQTNSNHIGTCNNYDFVLKAYDKKGLFITAANTYVGIGENNSNPTALLDLKDPAYSNTDHLRIFGDTWGTIEASNEMNLYYNSNFVINKGGYGTTWTPVLKIDNSGKVGINTSITLAHKFTVDAGSSDGILNRTSSSTSKGLSVYNTSTSKTNFAVLGNGITILGDASVGANAASLNINLSTGTAISVYNSAATIHPVYFAVLGNGITHIGDASLRTNTVALTGSLNINMASTAATNVAISVYSKATETTTLRIMGNGATYIGASKPDGNHANAMLSVDGKILARSIYVNTASNVWADYVFDKSYELIPLREVEEFYSKNRHLPGVPSSEEMMKNGDNLIETDAMLLRKIEELTIYLVQLEKELEELRKMK